MNPNEIKLYLGIIVSNFTSVFLFAIIALINARIYSFAVKTVWLSLVLVLILMALVSAFFWRHLQLHWIEYLKLYLLNILVALFWFLTLFY
ncbi:MAG: hypothetical protein NW226_26965 [Microscillaceae bacterium]|nr:hypothetical protein [Microscillaceae bacterium]